MRSYLNDRDLRYALAGILSFLLLEAWLFNAAYVNRFQKGGYAWEGPLSLAALILSLCFLARYLLRHNRLALLCLGLGLGLLAFVLSAPLTPPPKSKLTLRIYKSERLLEVVQGREILASYPVALGDPLGDKRLQGDQKTPEGNFLVCDKGPSVFHKWLGVNYPRNSDAWEGRKKGLITWLEFCLIRVQNLNGQVPYSRGALGGAIGIHGGGAGKDWTLGCGALQNEDIDAFYDEIPLGTVVEILP